MGGEGNGRSMAVVRRRSLVWHDLCQTNEVCWRLLRYYINGDLKIRVRGLAIRSYSW